MAAGPPGPSPPPAKRGPVSEFDDILEDADDMFDELPEAYMPDADDADGSGAAAAAEPDLCEAGRNWLRPPVANLQPAVDALGERDVTGEDSIAWLREAWRGTKPGNAAPPRRRRALLV